MTRCGLSRGLSRVRRRLLIELPEAFVIAEQVRETVAGKRIAQAVANASPHKFAWYTGDPAEYNGRLAGRTVTDARSLGGAVEILADDMLLSVSAPLRFHTQGGKRPKKHQLLVEFGDGTAISSCAQMWGGFFCSPADQEGGWADRQMAKSHPSPLAAAFDRVYFDSLLATDMSKLSTKAFLATGQRIPGLGNGVLQDILWTARIHPKCMMDSLSGEQIDRMYSAVKQVLADMTEQGGRDTEKDLFWQPGGYRTVLSRNTVGQPCPVCKTVIRKEAYLGGSIYYCDGCQPL
jgi:formamidopyrimidine-DNA glycosylase